MSLRIKWSQLREKLWAPQWFCVATQYQEKSWRLQIRRGTILACITQLQQKGWGFCHEERLKVCLHMAKKLTSDPGADN